MHLSVNMYERKLFILAVSHNSILSPGPYNTVTGHCSCDSRAQFWEVSQDAPAVPSRSVVGWDWSEQKRTSHGVSSAGAVLCRVAKSPLSWQLTGKNSPKGAPEEGGSLW